MSYCRKEGKDVIIFATEEDLAGPSKVELQPDKPEEVDLSHQGSILPDGTINWDCPCLGSLPYGPCGPMFREAFTCWVENKDNQDSFAENCFENFAGWENCLSEHREVYKSSKSDEDEEHDDIDAGGIDNSKNSKPEITDSNHEELDSTENVGTSVDSRPAIAAAYVEENSNVKKEE